MTDYQTAERMALKEKAIPLPSFKGKSVLDVGCDHGHWCWLAADRGAKQVVGLDRGRSVSGVLTDLAKRNQTETGGRPCLFYGIDLGRQWFDYGKFDVVLCFSMYHHVFQNCGEHEPIWFWLCRHTTNTLLWENPTGEDDPVVKMHVTRPYHRDDILVAADRYFHVENIGPALHVPTREVWRCQPRALPSHSWDGKSAKGVGGATKAFEYANGHRIHEIENAIGVRVIPGSLNVQLDRPFNWDRRYYRAEIMDVKDRRAGLDSEWAPRWCRIYPVWANNVPAFGFRFEGEKYDDNFLELIAETRLRDVAPHERVSVRSR